MEEQQIQDFVHQVAVDDEVRQHLAGDPAGVIMLQEFSPRVAQIISRLVPHLAFEQPVDSNEKWWHA